VWGVHTYNSNTWETKAGGFWVQGQSGLQSKTCLKNPKQQNKKIFSSFKENKKGFSFAFFSYISQ
jgi:hypothetical protein